MLSRSICLNAFRSEFMTNKIIDNHNLYTGFCLESVGELQMCIQCIGSYRLL